MGLTRRICNLYERVVGGQSGPSCVVCGSESHVAKIEPVTTALVYTCPETDEVVVGPAIQDL